MKDQDVIIRKGSVEEAVDLSLLIPEFENPHRKEIYYQRLEGKCHLIAIAEVNGKPVGFKVGYDKFDDKSFYTWMGGVLPSYRKLGIARKLADYQEEFAKKEGYESIILKTRNRHQNMLLFAISSGFEIIDVEIKDTVKENRILLKKLLLSK